MYFGCSGMYFGCLNLYFECLDLYFGCLNLYLCVWTCICGVWTCILVREFVFPCMDLFVWCMELNVVCLDLYWTNGFKSDFTHLSISKSLFLCIRSGFQVVTSRICNSQPDPRYLHGKTWSVAESNECPQEHLIGLVFCSEISSEVGVCNVWAPDF